MTPAARRVDVVGIGGEPGIDEHRALRSGEDVQVERDPARERQAQLPQPVGDRRNGPGRAGRGTLHGPAVYGRASDVPAAHGQMRVLGHFAVGRRGKAASR
jgi:hypothetical protein